jgi:hypothetical protein
MIARFLNDVSQKAPTFILLVSPLMQTYLSVLITCIISGYVGIEFKINISPYPEAINKIFL